MKLDQLDETHLIQMANAIRALSMDAVQLANSGHPGMPMGMADVATVLFAKIINIYPDQHDWINRDRFILSAGHGSMLLYALYHLIGFDDMTIDQIKNFRQLGFRTPGHPEYRHSKGIETTTGPLGQGLANSVGMALSESILRKRFGRDLINHFIYSIVGDGCLMEGISHEVMDLAGHMKLNHLIVLWDDNEISIDGNTKLTTSTNQIKRFESSGWDTQSVDGHDFIEIENAILRAKKTPSPSLIAFKTKIGFGSPNLEGTNKVHGAPLGEDEIIITKQKLNWKYPPFILPENVVKNWKATSNRSALVYNDWKNNLEKSNKKNHFLTSIKGEIPQNVWDAILKQRKEIKISKPVKATRQSSQQTLEIINSNTDLTIGGSADLTGSNLTFTKKMKPISKENMNGSYIHYGVREHGMGAVMNGISLHGGLIPYGGTFLVFSDYMRGAMRLSAIMGLRVIYVLTHDSIGLGEDGPTHQPVEHLAMLRATPNLLVFRPSDSVEVNEAWELSLKSESTPSVLALSRQALPTLRNELNEDNLSSYGAYIIYGEHVDRDLTILASGSEVSLAVEVAESLKNEKNLSVTVISMPCWELFDNQSDLYKERILGSVPRIAIEAAVKFGWEKWLRKTDYFIGMKGFGASGPAKELFNKFGINKNTIIEKAKSILAKNE